MYEFDALDNGEITCPLFSLPLPELRNVDKGILPLYYSNKSSEDTYYLISEIALQCLTNQIY